MQVTRRRGPLAISILALLALAAALATLRGSPRSLELRTGTLLPQPQPIAGFELVDQRGQAFTRNSFRGAWSLAFMGFTHCPDICPTTLGLLTALDKRLQADGIELRLVFISVDPRRDTPQRLAGYLENFAPRMLGVTGARAQIDALRDSLRLSYIEIPGGESRYRIDHSGALVLVDPDARVVGYFKPPLALEPLLADLAALPNY